MVGGHAPDRFCIVVLLSELISSMRSYYKEDPRVRIFDLFIAAVVKHPAGGDRPVFQGQALDFIVDLFKRLRDEKQVTKESIAADANAYIELQRGVRGTRVSEALGTS